MRSVSLSSPRHLTSTPKPGFLTSVAERAVLSRLKRLQTGKIVLLQNGRERCFGNQADVGLTARIEVRDPRFFPEVAFGGSIGAGEAYMQGFWKCDDLVALVRILLRNRSVLEAMDSGPARLTEPVQKLFHWVNRNTHAGARRNISAHYDLGNEFFALWLDPTMMYSCAIFTEEGASLHQAQLNRLDHICKKLQLSSGDHLLEIGTGWGGFALFAARNYGCRVTTTTISQQQYDLAAQRIAKAGLQDKILLLKDDFRDLRGQYDKLVSIEMIEAIGSALYATFFRRCSELLKPNGLMLLQAITIADQQYAASQKSVDFIQRYIFPGGALPSCQVMTRNVSESSDMRLLDLLDIGLHYATTLRHWRKSFFDQIEQVRALGYSETFIRMWEYYLCYCEGAFLERAISDVLMVFSKPQFRAALGEHAA